MELPHFHVLHRHTGTQGHAHAVTGIDMGIGGGLEDTTGAAGSQNGGLGLEVHQLTGFDVDGGTANHITVLIFHQIQRIPFGENGGLVLDVLLIKGVQQGMTGTVRRRGSTRRLLATEGLGLAAEGTLIHLAVVETRERQTHFFQLEDGLGTGLTHEFNRVLVTDIVGSLDGIVHVPFPVVLVGIAQRYRNAALGGYGMRTGRKNLGQQCTAFAGFGYL